MLEKYDFPKSFIISVMFFLSSSARPLYVSTIFGILVFHDIEISENFEAEVELNISNLEIDIDEINSESNIQNEDDLVTSGQNSN